MNGITIASQPPSSRESRSPPDQTGLTRTPNPVGWETVKLSPGSRLDVAFGAALRTWLPPEVDYLLAVSGGRDSMTLLHFLRNQGYERLIVCHADHQLRGAESAKDRELVATTAEDLGLEFETQALEVASHAKTAKKSIETAARELRYDWLAGVAQAREIPRLITAHHADDQVETVLMRLFRGAGSQGLSGMAMRSTRRIAGMECEILRPFLPVFGEEIERYASAHRVAFREDESNAETIALRNRVRHQLLPMIGEVFQRDVRMAVIRAAELAGRDEGFINGQIDYDQIATGKELSVAILREMPQAKRDRLLLRWFAERGVQDCGFDEVARAAAVLLSDEKPAKANLPGGHFVRRSQGRFFIESPTD